jgi:carbon starvation protein
MTAGWQKIFAEDPAIGFLAQAARLGDTLGAGGLSAAKAAELRVQIFNLRLDAAVAALFMGLVALIVVEAARAWYRALRGPAPAAALRPVLEP